MIDGGQVAAISVAFLARNAATRWAGLQYFDARSDVKRTPQCRHIDDAVPFALCFAAQLRCGRMDAFYGGRAHG